MTERQFQRLVLDLARLTGWRVAHFHDSRRQVRPGVFVGDADAKGFPDLVLVHPEHGVAYAELKREDGKVRREQAEWIDSLTAAGARVFVWRPSHWPLIEAFLTTGGAAPTGGGLTRIRERPAAPPIPFPVQEHPRLTREYVSDL